MEQPPVSGVALMRSSDLGHARQALLALTSRSWGVGAANPVPAIHTAQGERQALPWQQRSRPSSGYPRP